MRVLVTGCRDWEPRGQVWGELDRCILREQLSTLVLGDCPTGADRAAFEWYMRLGVHSRPALRVLHADWSTHGNSAGPLRNSDMVQVLLEGEKDERRVALAFWDGHSRGTLDCLSKCVRAGFLTKVVPLRALGGSDGQ